MSRERRLVREGKKLLVIPENVSTMHGDSYWTPPKFLAQHPKYEKHIIESDGKILVIDVASSMGVNLSPIATRHVDEIVPPPSGTAMWQRVTYDVGYEVIDTGTWYYLHPEIMRLLEDITDAEERARRYDEIKTEVVNGAPHKTATVEQDGKTLSFELNNWQADEIGGVVRIKRKRDFATGKFVWYAEPSGADAFARVLVKTTKSNVLIYEPPSSGTPSRGNDTVSYSTTNVSAFINITARGQTDISVEQGVSAGGIAANPFSVKWVSDSDDTVYYEAVDDDDFTPGIDWKEPTPEG